MPPLAYFGIESSGLNLIIDLLILFAVVLYCSLIYWTYTDARRRIADPIMIGFATVVACAFPFLGAIIYLILRPPEYLEDVRERELDTQAAEARVRLQRSRRERARTRRSGEPGALASRQQRRQHRSRVLVLEHTHHERQRPAAEHLRQRVHKRRDRMRVVRAVEHGQWIFGHDLQPARDRRRRRRLAHALLAQLDARALQVHLRGDTRQREVAPLKGAAAAQRRQCPVRRGR